jgi:co-chaperonin GroES (HSP10)
VTFRAFADNVAIVLEPLETMTQGGLHLPQRTERGALGCRFAKVIASGPGHWAQRRGGAGSTVEMTRAFVPNETKPGDRVLLPALSGTNFDLDISIPRHNKGDDFKELLGEQGEFRIVREAEILAIVTESDG